MHCVCFRTHFLESAGIVELFARVSCVVVYVQIIYDVGRLPPDVVFWWVQREGLLQHFEPLQVAKVVVADKKVSVLFFWHSFKFDAEKSNQN